MHHFTLDKMNLLLNNEATGSVYLAFEGLEPYAGKLASTVFRGQRGRETPELPGALKEFGYLL